jgi:hypothetical protein
MGGGMQNDEMEVVVEIDDQPVSKLHAGDIEVVVDANHDDNETNTEEKRRCCGLLAGMQ